jgi:hypothetical protein
MEVLRLFSCPHPTLDPHESQYLKALAGGDDTQVLPIAELGFTGGLHFESGIAMWATALCEGIHKIAVPLPTVTAPGTGYHTFGGSAPDMSDAVLVCPTHLCIGNLRQSLTRIEYLLLEFGLRLHN